MQGPRVLLRRLRRHPHHPRRDAADARADRRTNAPASSRRPIRDPVTGAELREQHDSRRDRSIPYAAAIIALVPLPNQPGANNFFRLRRPHRRLGSAAWRGSTGGRTPNDSVFGRYIYSNRQRQHSRAPSAGSSTAPARRRSATRQSRPTRWSAAGRASCRSAMVNEFRLSWSQADSDAVHQAFGLAPPAEATIPGSITDPAVAGGLPGITIDGYFGGSGLGRIGSPDFLPKFQHTNQFEFLEHAVLAARRPRLQVRRERHVADEERVPGRSGHARRDALPQTLHRQPDGRLPARLRLRPPALQRVGGRAAALGHDVLRPGRLEGHAEVVAESRPALRLHHAGAGGRTTRRPTSTRPAAAAWCSPATARSRTAAWSSPTRTTSRLGSASSTSSTRRRSSAAAGASSTTCSTASAAKTSSRSTSRAGQHIADAARPASPVFFLRRRVPGDFLTPPNLDPAAGQLRNLRLRAVTNDAPKTTIQQASVGRPARAADRHVVLTVDFVYTKGTQPRHAGQPEPAAAERRRQQRARRAALSELRVHRVARAERASPNTRASTSASSKRFPRATRSASRTRSATRRTTPSEHLTTQGSNRFPQNSRDLERWYGPSDYDVRHRLPTNFVVELPFGEALARPATGSSRASYAWRSGRPFTVNQGNNNVGSNMTGLPEPGGRPRRPGDGRAVVQRGRVPGRALRHVRQRAAATRCAGRTGRAST